MMCYRNHFIITINVHGDLNIFINSMKIMIILLRFRLYFSLRSCMDMAGFEIDIYPCVNQHGKMAEASILLSGQVHQVALSI